VKFKVLTALAVKTVFFWDMTPCTLACCIQRNACSVLVGKPEERRLLEIPINRWDVILRWILQEKRQRVSTVFCGLGEGFGMSCYEYDNEPWGYKEGEFLE
jgi:hypothetical protein